MAHSGKNQPQAALYDTFRAMNTDIEVILHYTSRENCSPVVAFKKIRFFFEEAEATMSRFDPYSELSRLNQAGFLLKSSLLLFDTVSQALKLAAWTEGIFDPTISRALQAAGYNRSFEQIQQNMGIFSAAKYITNSKVNYRQIELESESRTIKLPPETEIDLGGIAKGATVDRAARWLKKVGFGRFMVSAGGDMYLSGTWTVGILNPCTLEGDLRDIEVTNRAVATSATTKRRWQLGNHEQNHLIDPRTGESVQNNLAAVTAITPTTTQADVLAKSALILGSECGKIFVEKQEHCGALFVTKQTELSYAGDFPK